MAESIQQRLTRERPPRVKITYDVETGGAIVKTELPFVMGVMADLSGDREGVERQTKRVRRDGKTAPAPVNWQDYPERAFVEIDKDNFHEVLAEFAPRLQYAPGDTLVEKLHALKIPDTEARADGQIEFNHLDDFTPDSIVSRVSPLSVALKERNVIRDLYTRMDMDREFLNTCYSCVTGIPMKASGGKPPAGGDAGVTASMDAVKEAIAGAVKAAMEKQETRDGVAHIGKTKTEEEIKTAIGGVVKAAIEGDTIEADAETAAKAIDARAIAAIEGAVRTAVSDAETQAIAANAGKDFVNDESVKAAVRQAAEAALAAAIAEAMPGPGGDEPVAKTLPDVENMITAMKMSDESAAAAKECFARLANRLDTAKLYGAEKPKTLDQANPRKLIETLEQEVTDIDAAIAMEMNRILHGKKFQNLEAGWRGLFYLVRNTATGTGLKLKVLNAASGELSKDLAEAPDFDQSHLFKIVCEETYGTQGGHPYSCLLHAHEYGRDAGEVAFADSMTAVAAAAHAPLLTAASPDLFNLKSFRDLAVPRDLAKIFESAEHIKWNSLREKEDSRYLAMCLPRVLMRAPYTPSEVKSFAYDEALSPDPGTYDPAKPEHDCYLWGNAAYALAARITTAFALYNWTAAIRGMEGGGLVEDLPLHNYTRPSGDIVTKIPTEIALTDRREKELSDLGFISLCYRLGTDKAVFFGGQTVNKPLKYLENDATANANLSARLPYILNASRFAHYVKSIMRDKIGSFLDRESVETFMNNWLSAYVLLTDNASQNLKASYPLREARVDVVEDEANPGAYRAIMYLRPHFQMEELLVSIRLVAKLPAPAA